MESTALGHADNIVAWGSSAGLYDGLFGGLPLHVVDRVKHAIERIQAHKGSPEHPNREITVLDYGCGTGRYLPLLQEIAEREGLNIRYLALDSHANMLRATEKLALEQGYAPLPMRNTFPINDPLHVEKSQGHRGPAYKKQFGAGSVTVQLLQPNIIRQEGEDGPIATPGFLKEALLNEHIDLSLCMFGVLSYCHKQGVRHAILDLLNEVTDGPILVSSPTPQRDPQAYAHHVALRAELAAGPAAERHKELLKELGDAHEHGNTYILYPAMNAEGQIEMRPNLYHMYETEQFTREMQDAGMQGLQVGCVNILSEGDITKNNKLNLTDYRHSVNLPPEEYDRTGKFLFADMLSTRAAAEGMQPADAFYPPSPRVRDCIALHEQQINGARGMAAA